MSQSFKNVYDDTQRARAYAEFPRLSTFACVSCLTILAGLAACRATGEASDPMAWAVGSWHGVRRAADDGRESPMTVRVEALPYGAGQVESLRVEETPTPYIGFTVRLRDDAGGWTMVYVNSTDHPFARLAGEIAGDRVTWRSVTPGRSRESRLTSEHPGPTTWRKTQEVSEDGGRNWRVLFTDLLERTPEPDR